MLGVLAFALVLIVGPLRPGRLAAGEALETAEHADLEAAKEAKYREIRDAELDHHTGKLSHEDWQALDASLRREAIELLRRLDALDGDRRRSG